MRLTDDQARGLQEVLSGTFLEVQHDEDPGSPPWLEVEPVDGADIRLLSVRFPGNCMRSPADREKAEELGNQPHAIGVFVALLDDDGEVVYAKHTGVGRLELDRNRRVVAP